MASRGADLSWLSQYPHEKECTFPPLTVLEHIKTSVEGTVTIVELRPVVSSAAEVEAMGTMPVADASALFDAFDADGSSAIDREEFENFVAALATGGQTADEALRTLAAAVANGSQGLPTPNATRAPSVSRTNNSRLSVSGTVRATPK